MAFFFPEKIPFLKEIWWAPDNGKQLSQREQPVLLGSKSGQGGLPRQGMHQPNSNFALFCPALIWKQGTSPPYWFWLPSWYLSAYDNSCSPVLGLSFSVFPSLVCARTSDLPVVEIFLASTRMRCSDTEKGFLRSPDYLQGWCVHHHDLLFPLHADFFPVSASSLFCSYSHVFILYLSYKSHKTDESIIWYSLATFNLWLSCLWAIPT